MNESKHWDQVYERRAPDQVSWYRPHLERSLALIEPQTPGGAEQEFVYCFCKTAD